MRAAFCSLVISWAMLFIAPTATSTLAADEQRSDSDDAAKIAFLTSQTVADDDLLSLDQLIRMLSSSHFQERQKAANKLSSLGGVAVPKLLVAMRDPDPEVAARANSCFRRMDPDLNASAEKALCAVRLLGKHKCKEALPVLLRYLPSAVSEELVEEVYYALETLALQAPSVPTVLLSALEDPLPSRRAVAAGIVARKGKPTQLVLARKLLNDPNPLVRLRAAQGFLATKDKTVIPVLVALLREPSVELSWQAEELLHWSAAGSAPPETVGNGTPERRNGCQKAWEAWWRSKGPQLDLAKLRGRPCLFFLSSHTSAPDFSWIELCGSDGASRWRLNGACSSVSPQLLPGNRILVPGPEYPNPLYKKPSVEEGPLQPRTLGSLTERSVQGTVLWQITLPEVPVIYRRLPNGSTFIYLCDRNKALELTPDQTLAGQHDAPSEQAPPIRSRSRAFVPMPGPDVTPRIPEHLRPSFPYKLRNGNTMKIRRTSNLVRVCEVDPVGRVVAEIIPNQLGKPAFPCCLRLVSFGFDQWPAEDMDMDSAAYRVKKLKEGDVFARRKAALILRELGPAARTAKAPLLVFLLAKLALNSTYLLP
jgi:HEAT repeat protein